MIAKSAIILHADLDAFYASVEQRERPELRGKPVAVGGGSPRGVVAAASYEARRFGVRSAMPSFEARRRCPDLIFLRGNMALYKRESRRVFKIFSEFSPLVESISLDEAFLDLAGTERLMGSTREVGEALRFRVREELDLPVSVGIGPVKMVAKIASELAKPDGLVEVASEDVRQFLNPLPLRRIWGIGVVAEKKLTSAGFLTLGDLASASDHSLRENFGQWGIEIASLARGQDIREVDPYRDTVSYSEENTFAEDVTDETMLGSAIRSHAESVARRLRHDHVRALTIVLKWKEAQRVAHGPHGYPVHTRRVTLSEGIDDGSRIAEEAKKLLAQSWPVGPVRLLGVCCTNLINETSSQLSIFPSAEIGKRDKLNQVLDRITDRFGKNAVMRATKERVGRAALSLQIKRGDDD